MADQSEDIGIIADVHANREALEVALETLEGEGVERYVVLGDLIGYNASPKAVMDRLMDLQNAMFINGNHDRYLTGETPMFGLSREVIEAIKWTRRKISDEHEEFLSSLEKTRHFDDQHLLVHGSPRDPDEYITTFPLVRKNLEYLKEEHPEVKYCFFGHSHIPVVARPDGTSSQVKEDSRFDLSPEGPYLINVGSVGQPRDGDPKAAFGRYAPEEKALYIYRKSYDLEAEQRKIRESPLTDYFARRLALGE